MTTLTTTMPRTRRYLVALTLGSLCLATGCASDPNEPTGTRSTGSASTSPSASDLDRSLCQNANDYRWYLEYFGGQQPSGPPQSADTLKFTVQRLEQLALTLETQVPTPKSRQARNAAETFKTENELYATFGYDAYDAPSDLEDKTEQLVGQYRTSNEQYLTYLTTRCRPKISGFPTIPADADNVR